MLSVTWNIYSEYQVSFLIAQNLSCPSLPPNNVSFDLFLKPLQLIYFQPPTFASQLFLHCGPTAVGARGALIPVSGS